MNKSDIEPAVDPPTGNNKAATENARIVEPATGGKRPRWPHWLAAAIIAALFSNWLVPRLSVVFDLIGSFQWQLVLIAIGLAILQLVRKQTLSGLLILLLVAWPALNLCWFFLPADQPDSVTRTIRIMSFNVLESNDRYQETLDYIREVNPDIVGLVEFHKNWREAFRDELKEYPHKVGPYSGNVIYSKIPLDEQTTRQHFNEPRLSPANFVVFSVDGQPVYFLLVHARSPKTPSRLVERDSQIQGIQTSLMFESAFRHVVAMGDFNSTSHSYALDTMMRTSRLRDSRYGFGLQNSWPTWFWPVSVCIDHCFISDEVRIEDRFRGPALGSDHNPLVVDLSFGRHPRTKRESDHP